MEIPVGTLCKIRHLPGTAIKTATKVAPMSAFVRDNGEIVWWSTYDEKDGEVFMWEAKEIIKEALISRCVVDDVSNDRLSFKGLPGMVIKSNDVHYLVTQHWYDETIKDDELKIKVKLYKVICVLNLDTYKLSYLG